MLAFDDDDPDATIWLDTDQPRCGTLPRLLEPTLDQTVRDRIRRDLCGMYGELFRQPVPDRILDLIARLDRTGRGTLQ
jgi:hypothetical protein